MGQTSDICGVRIMATVAVNELSELILAVFRLNGRISEWGDLICASLGLSTTRWQILGAIRLAACPVTAPQIAHTMGLTRQGVQKQLYALMDAGFVAQQPNPRHERSHLYTLTMTGRAVEEKAVALYADWIEQATAGMTNLQITEAVAVLKNMTGNIERILHKNSGV